MRYYDPTKRNFGYTIRDIWELLPMADEINNKTFFISNGKEVIDIRTEKEFQGKFAAKPYMGNRYIGFKYTMRITTHTYKNSVESWTQFWVDLDD